MALVIGCVSLGWRGIRVSMCRSREMRVVSPPRYVYGKEEARPALRLRVHKPGGTIVLPHEWRMERRREVVGKSGDNNDIEIEMGSGAGRCGKGSRTV